MKEQIFGLKKEPIDAMIQKMENDFLYEKVGLEYELNMLIKENNAMRAQLKAHPGKNSIANAHPDLWSLGKERINRMADFLLEQTAKEMADLQKASSQSCASIKLEIQKIESEIRATEQSVSKLFDEIASLVTGSEAVEKNAEPTTFVLDDLKQVPEPIRESAEPELPATGVPATGFETIKERAPQIEEEDDEPSIYYRDPEKDREESLLEEIDAIKTQYIVGKIAGEHLFDSRGNLIIAKSHMITKKDVNYAHREGKLAELIMKMKITGLGEG